MTRPSAEASVAIRYTLQRGVVCIDVGDWECFSPEAQSVYNGDAQVLVGGAGVAAFVQRATAQYASTVHDLAGCHVELTGDGVEAGGTWLIVRRQHVALWQSDVTTIPPWLRITEPKGL